MKNKLQQQNNSEEKNEKARPPYRWDKKLKEITEEVKKIIEKEETNVGEDKK